MKTLWEDLGTSVLLVGQGLPPPSLLSSRTSSGSGSVVVEQVRVVALGFSLFDRELGVGLWMGGVQARKKDETSSSPSSSTCTTASNAKATICPCRHGSGSSNSGGRLRRR